MALLTTVPMRMIKPSMDTMSERLGFDQQVDQPQAHEPAGCRHRHAEKDDQRVKEIFEQGCHQQ